MTSDSRIERIEDAVIKLEKDMAVMTSSITALSTSVHELSSSMQDLVKLHGDQELLKQEIDYAKKSFSSDLDVSKADRINLWKEVADVRQKCLTLERDILNNSFFTKNASKLGWVFIAAAISFMFYMVRTFG